MTSLVRLNKYLANLGVASRRTIDEYIAAGRISVNGEIVKLLGDKINPQKDSITVDGKPVKQAETLVYIILNKPKGIISTAEDTHGRQTVLDLVNSPTRLYPVGRLDQDSQGLILLTNDGDLTYKLTHPKFHTSKTYRVTVLGNVKDGKIEQLRNGVELEDGLTAPAEIAVLESQPHLTVLKMILYEGRKRQIRRMCAALHLHILELIRTAIGPIELGNLHEGMCRDLINQEVKQIKQAIGSDKD